MGGQPIARLWGVHADVKVHAPAAIEALDKVNGMMSGSVSTSRVDAP